MAHHDRTIFAGWVRWVGHNLGQRIPEHRRGLVKGYAMLLTVASRFGLVPLELQVGHGAASVLLQLATSGHFWVGLTPRSAAALHLAGAVSCILLFYGIRESLRSPSRQSSRDLHCGTPSALAPVAPAHPQGARLRPYAGPACRHKDLSTPEACKGRDAPSSALALRTDPGQSTHFHAPGTGRGAALGLRHEATARMFPIPLTQTAFVFAHRVCRTLRSAAKLHSGRASSAASHCSTVAQSLRRPSRQSSHDPSLWNSARPSEVVSLTRRTDVSDEDGGPALSPTAPSRCSWRARAVMRPSQHSRSAPVQPRHSTSKHHGRGAARTLAYATKRRPGYSPCPTQTGFVFAHHVRRTPRSAASLHSNRGSSAASCCCAAPRFDRCCPSSR